MPTEKFQLKITLIWIYSAILGMCKARWVANRFVDAKNGLLRSIVPHCLQNTITSSGRIIKWIAYYLEIDLIQSIDCITNFPIFGFKRIEITENCMRVCFINLLIIWPYYKHSPRRFERPTYRWSVFNWPDKISRNVSISAIFSRKPPTPRLGFAINEFDCNETVLPCRINETVSTVPMPLSGLYDCNTSIQCILSSGFSARKYHTQLFTETSKRHSSNSWLCVHSNNVYK